MPDATLPPQTIDHMHDIDHLHNDKEAFSFCSLVAKQWVNTRQRLDDHIRVVYAECKEVDMFVQPRQFVQIHRTLI